MEYEQRQVICEAQTAREVEQQQQQQATFTQFRMFRELVANQEAAGRLIHDLSSDT